MRRVPVAVLLAVSLLAGAGCGPQIDLKASLAVTDVFSGWYDFGIVQDQLNKLVPSISFRLKNVGSDPINEVQLTVSFWRDGDDGEWDSKEVTGIGRESVAPGAMSEPILVRSDIGYTLEQPRAEMFTHSQFKNVRAKIFAKRSGQIVPIGEFQLDQRIIPHETSRSQ